MRIGLFPHRWRCGRKERAARSPPSSRIRRLERAGAAGRLDRLAGSLGHIFPGMGVIVHLRLPRATVVAPRRAIVLPFERDAITFLLITRHLLASHHLGRGGGGEDRERGCKSCGRYLSFVAHERFLFLGWTRILLQMCDSQSAMPGSGAPSVPYSSAVALVNSWPQWVRRCTGFQHGRCTPTGRQAINRAAGAGRHDLGSAALLQYRGDTAGYAGVLRAGACEFPDDCRADCVSALWILARYQQAVLSHMRRKGQDCGAVFCSALTQLVL